jgi:hypothetical protein
MKSKCSACNTSDELTICIGCYDGKCDSVRNLQKGIKGYERNNARLHHIQREICEIAGSDLSVIEARQMLRDLDDVIHEDPPNKIHLKDGSILLVNDDVFDYVAKLMDENFNLKEKLKKGRK